MSMVSHMAIAVIPCLDVLSSITKNIDSSNDSTPLSAS
jgi:hypothetical protein